MSQTNEEVLIDICFGADEHMMELKPDVMMQNCGLL
jgi:hypothetical protein